MSGKKFESDSLAQRQVVCPIDLAHASFSKQRDDPVAAGDQTSGKKASFVQQESGYDDGRDDDFGAEPELHAVAGARSRSRSRELPVRRCSPQVFRRRSRNACCPTIPFRRSTVGHGINRYRITQGSGVGVEFGRKRLSAFGFELGADARKPTPALYYHPETMSSRLAQWMRDPLFLLCLAAGLLAFVVQSGELGSADTMHRLQTTHWLWTSQPQVSRTNIRSSGCMAAAARFSAGTASDNLTDVAFGSCGDMDR